MTTGKARRVTREMVDCVRRDIHSGHPVYANRAAKTLKDYIETGVDFDCEATRLNALNLYSTLNVRQ